MITVVVHRRNSFPLRRLLATAPQLNSVLRLLSYQKLFARRRIPRGTLIFTDFDLLGALDVDLAGQVANAALDQQPPGRILNHPAHVLERVPLLRKLKACGLNRVEVSRLDVGEMPTRYPVFIRSEDGYFGPETSLIGSEAELANAVAELKRAGRTLKRRIAVSFEAAPDKAGHFRKYGAFVIGDHIIPQHILRSAGWNVKSQSRERDPQFAAEEERYVEDNPHAAALRDICRVSGIAFGRVDYTMIDGAPVVFEINTNPTFPRFVHGDPSRAARRRIILARLAEAFAAVDDESDPSATFLFEPAGVPDWSYVDTLRWYEDLPYSLLQARKWRVLAGLVANRLGRP